MKRDTEKTSEELQSEIVALKSEKKEELAIEGFLKFINKEPNPNKLGSRNVGWGDNKKQMQYVPISAIENMLDTFFFGMWSTTNFEYRQIMNEVTGSIQLRVKHPITGDWLERTGASSVVFRQKSGTEILEIAQHKIKDGLTMDIPHLKSECIKNASKLLGNAFGRNVSRDITDNYVPLITEIVDSKAKKVEERAGDKSLLDTDSKTWSDLLAKKTPLSTVKFHYDFLSEEDEKLYVKSLTK